MNEAAPKAIVDKVVACPRMLPLRQVKGLTSLPTSTIYQMMSEGLFPRPVKLSPRRVAWLEPEIHEWLAERIAERDNSVHGFIYIIEVAGNIKIGYSTYPTRRIAELQVGAAEEIVVHVVFPGTLVTEKTLHRRFHRSRMQGEWFRKSPAILEYIRKMRGDAARGLIDA